MMETALLEKPEYNPAFRFQDTTATKRIFGMSGRIRAVAGGTSASKTISILVWLIDYCQTTSGKICSVVSESYPHLEDGAMRDFKSIMRDRGYWRDENWHGTRHEYTFADGSIIEFMAVDTYGKAHGPRRDVLYVNECNNLTYPIVDQLITRTREIVWLDWNPSEEFWFYTEMQPNRDDIEFITLTYMDNEALLYEPGQITIKEIESHRHNKNWWTVYGLGQLGEVSGRIFTGWAIIDEVPHTARLMRRGLDFGFSVDPAAIVDVYYHDGGYILDEKMYLLNQGNPALATFLLNMEQPDVVLVADSAEPKSISELKRNGVMVLGAEKGPGSLNRSIRHMQDQRISVTRESVNLIKEYRKYMWKFDKNGENLKVPEDRQADHLLDAARYALESLVPKKPEKPPRYEEPAISTLIY
jgi:phage terminase large subunit